MNEVVRNLLAGREQREHLYEGLPELFRKAEVENRRNGRLGQEIGNVRENIIRAYLQTQLGAVNVSPAGGPNNNLGDVMIGRDYLEVKTTMGVRGFKVSWAADDDSAARFRQQWKPQADLILVQVRWGSCCESFWHIPQEVYEEAAALEGALKTRSGTNNRGTDFERRAVLYMMQHKDTLGLTINWGDQDKGEAGIFQWVNLWNEIIARILQRNRNAGNA